MSPRRTCLLAFALACLLAGGRAHGESNTLRLTFLHVNDSHGVGVTPGASNDCLLARVATLVDDVRREGGAARVFLTVGGDIGVCAHDGDPLTAQRHGEAEILAFNRLGVDFMAPGNHEFDLGLAWSDRLMAASAFPWLCANLARKGETNLFTGRAQAVVDAAGVRVAFFGLCPGRGESWSVQAGIRDLDARDEIETATNLVPRLRAQADVVVGLTHIGLPRDERLARETGVDLILGAHSHTRLEGAMVDRTRIVQARWHYECVGRADLLLERRDGAWRVVDTTSRLLPTAGVAPDPGMLAFLQALSVAPPEAEEK